MKTENLPFRKITFAILFVSYFSFQQVDTKAQPPTTCDTWVQQPNFLGGPLSGFSGWTLGSDIFVSLGSTNGGVLLSDVWKFTPPFNNSGNGTWTQMSPFPGIARGGAISFNCNGYGYITGGVDANNNELTDTWEYNPQNDSWQVQQPFPGPPRSSGFSLSLNNRGYLGTGIGQTISAVDWWEFDPTRTIQWVQKPNLPGGLGFSYSGISFESGGKGYVGFGNNGNGSALSNYFWEYTPPTVNDPDGIWTRKADLLLPADGGRYASTAFAICGNGYVGLGINPSQNYIDEIWKYNVSQNSWSQVANFPGGFRESARAFATSNAVFLGLGYKFVPNTITRTDDWWQFFPCDLDDGNLCTVDACDMITGVISHTAINIDDVQICTTDNCNTLTGQITHNPKYTAAEYDDNNPCTIDYCDINTGLIVHQQVEECNCVCDSGTLTSSLVINTGYDEVGQIALANNGQPDNNWKLTQQPSWSNLSLPANPPTIYYNPFNNPGFFPFSNSQWISPFPSGNGQNNLPGDLAFTFKYSFCLCNDDSITFDFHSLVDDSLVVYLDNYSTILNYQSFTNSGPQAGQQNYYYKIYLSKGKHYLKGDLRNYGGPLGFDIGGLISGNFLLKHSLCNSEFDVVDLGNDTTICSGDTATLNAAGCSGTLTWYELNNGIATALPLSSSQINVNPAQTTYYKVTCCDTSGCCKSDTVCVIVRNECNECDTNQTTPLLIVNTGYDEINNAALAIGARDKNWKVINAPASAAVILDDPSFTISYNYNSKPTFSNSQWISAFYPSTNVSNNPIDTPYIFDYTFCICEDDSVHFNLQAGLDDSLRLYVNDYQHGLIQSAYNLSGGLSYNQTFFLTKGTHHLRADLRNLGGGPMGFNIAGSISGNHLLKHGYCNYANAGNDTTVCNGSIVTLTGTVISGGTYEWFELPSYVSLGNQNPISFSATTSMCYAFIATNSSGSSDTDKVCIKVVSNTDDGDSCTYDYCYNGVQYHEPIRLGIRSLPGLQSVIFHEKSAGNMNQSSYGFNSSEILNRLPGTLDNTNFDFGGGPLYANTEYYDVFYSNANGVPDSNGCYISIEGVYLDAAGGGGFNISAVELLTSTGSLFACEVKSFVGIGPDFQPLSVSNILNNDLNSWTTMGGTSPSYNPSGQRLRITVGFCQQLCNCDGVSNSVTVNVNLLLQGYYTGNGLMDNSGSGGLLNILGISSNSLDVDTILISVMNAESPYEEIDHESGILKTNGEVTVTFGPAVVANNSYYLKLNHRNSIETWSAAPVMLTTTTAYSFSSATSQAFSSNEAITFDALFAAIYTGDINQDGAVDGSDFLDFDVASQAGEGGYHVADLNGDGAVDGSDFLLYDPNVQNGIGAAIP